MIERAVIIAEGKEIGVSDLPELAQQSTAAPPTPAAAANGDQLTLAEMERLAILQALERTNGNKRAAADLLGLYGPTLYGKLRKYKLGGAQRRRSRQEQPCHAAKRRETDRSGTASGTSRGTDGLM